MLEIVLPELEVFNESTEEFEIEPEVTLNLEHSLISISKWESVWETPFLDDNSEKTTEQVIDYIRAMTIGKVSPSVYNRLRGHHYKQISDYISSKQTATWFSNMSQEGSVADKEVVTSEIVYYWMLVHNIPWEAQKWHFSRLMTLIRVCNAKNSPEKKMSLSSIFARNRSLNEARRLKYGTKG